MHLGEANFKLSQSNIYELTVILSHVTVMRREKFESIESDMSHPSILIHAREDPIRSNSLNGRILDLFMGL